MAPPPPVNRYQHFDLLGWCYAQTDGSPTDRHVLLLLAIMANEHGVCWPTVRVLEDRTGISDRAIRRSIAHWRDNGALATEVRVDRKGKTLGQEYHLNPTRYPWETIEVEGEEALTDSHPLTAVPVPPDSQSRLIGKTSESPSTSLRSVSRRRSRHDVVEQERGSWLLEDGQEVGYDDGRTTVKVPRILRPRKQTPAQQLALAFQARTKQLGIPGTFVGELTTLFSRALAANVDRLVLAESIDMFFDGGYLRRGPGTPPPWLQYVNRVYALTEILNEKAKKDRPREKNTTYGAMPQHIIEETTRGVRTD